jgi:hypothetical protein
MPTINQLPVLSTISSGDQLPVYSPNNGDARRTSIGSLLTFFQQSFASPTVAVNLFVPTAGFNITVPTPVSNQQWMLLQPAGTLASGTITLPLNTGVPDGTEVLITSTQEITTFAISLNGATAIYGAVTTLAAGSAFAIRYYQATNSWYALNTTLIFATGIQSWLGNPSSANLRAAMTDETGTGLLVFNTSPALTTPTITNPTVTTGTFTSPTLVTPVLGTVTSGNISACTSTNMVLNSPAIGAATGTSLITSGTIASTGIAGIGYTTGAGAVVVQATSRTTGVTINKPSGSITLFSAAGTTVATTFTVTNSTVVATDVIILNQKSGTDLYDLLVTNVAAGSFNITFRTTGGSTTETPVFSFAVIKGVIA